MKIVAAILISFFLANSPAMADQAVPYEKILRETRGYFVVQLQEPWVLDPSHLRTQPFRLPASFPVEISGEFIVAGQYLFRKGDVRQGAIPFPVEAFLDVIKTYDPQAQFEPLRCPWNPVLGVVLLDEAKMIAGIVIMGNCYNSITLETPQGQSVDFRFPGLHAHTIDPLVEILAPGYRFQQQ